MKTQETNSNAAQPAGHTPGPLVVSKQYRSETIMQPQYWDVCTKRTEGADTILETVAENCSEADATLYAAAPELLECAEMLMLVCCEGKFQSKEERAKFLNMANAALAKAQGGGK